MTWIEHTPWHYRGCVTSLPSDEVVSPVESSLYTQLGYTTYTDVRGVVRVRSRVLLRSCSTEPGAAPPAAGCKYSQYSWAGGVRLD